MRNVAAVIAAILAVLAVSAFLLTGPRSDHAPKSVTRPALDSIINIHGSPEQGLNVCGKTFRNVRGGPPYYLAVTNTGLLLFAYEPATGGPILVVCDTNDRTFREIPLGDSVFGSQIGDWEATQGRMGDIVESVSSNRLFLLHKGFRYLERSVLDLESERIRVVQAQSEWNQLNLDTGTNLHQ